VKGSLEHILEGDVLIGVLGALGAALITYIVMSIVIKMFDSKKNK